jgi:hypothetical protein
MKLLKELNTFEDDMSNSSLKESETNEVNKITDPNQKTQQKNVNPDTNHGGLSDKGSFSSEVSS